MQGQHIKGACRDAYTIKSVKNVQVYIDDVVVKTAKSHALLDDLRETFDNLRRYWLKLNPTKCTFGVPAEKLLGSSCPAEA